MVRVRFALPVVTLLLVSATWAGIVDDVRDALAQKNFAAAESTLNSYKAKSGMSPEYAEALSWMGRAALADQQYDRAARYAKETERVVAAQLKTRTLDSDEHLPIALGAALEVQAQALAAQGRKAQAVTLLRDALHKYGNTSTQARLQKNLNMLTFAGQPAPALKSSVHIGPPVSLEQMKGSPALLFFWAHWCGDCKGEAPILARLRSEYGPRGLMLVAPTQRYGYAAGGEDASPPVERHYIENVWRQYYAGLAGVPVPVSKANFNVYGASTTPTLVLVDRRGKIAFYHPGALPYEELRAAIENVMK